LQRARNQKNVQAYVFEVDQRFAVYGESFVPYDLYKPLNIPASLCGTFDFVLVDPPYLNPDCLQHLKQTVDILVKKPYTQSKTSSGSNDQLISKQSSKKSQIAALEAIMFANPSDSSTGGYSQSCVVVNTGATLRDELVNKWHLKIMAVEPTHRTPLMNEFRCYTSYVSSGLGGIRKDE
jgi:hypothetical protein